MIKRTNVTPRLHLNDSKIGRKLVLVLQLQNVQMQLQDCTFNLIRNIGKAGVCIAMIKRDFCLNMSPIKSYFVGIHYILKISTAYDFWIAGGILG